MVVMESVRTLLESSTGANSVVCSWTVTKPIGPGTASVAVSLATSKLLEPAIGTTRLGTVVVPEVVRSTEAPSETVATNEAVLTVRTLLKLNQCLGIVIGADSGCCL